MDSPADYLGGHPLDRDGSDADSYLSFDSPPVLPLPSGTYTLLPLVDACDNVQFPTGPWSGQECKRRWEAHLAKERNAFAEEDTTAAAGDSALADDDEEDDHEQGPAAFDKEFLVPFFVALPSPPPPPSSSSSGASLRRRSSAASGNGRPSFSRLTPLPRLRSSSPTPSTSSFVRARADPSAAPEGAPPIGFLRPQVVRALIEDNRKLVAMNCRPVWAFQPAIATLNLATSAETGPWAVGFEDWVNEEGIDARKEHVDRLVRGWKHAGMFSECLGGWRDEEYTIYGPAPPPSADGDDNPLATGSNEALRMERSACALFGFATFGVHCTAYVEEEGEPLKLWVPRRSATKPTWPSMLDNTVAGGITAGDTPRASIIRECAEEASLSPQFVAPRIKQAGVVTYHYRTAAGWLQPEVQYVYDLRLPPPGSAGAEGDSEGTQPSTNPADGEVESFELLTLEKTVKRMCAGEFKPNCALVLVDFFMRHGLLTAESDTRFLEVAARLRKPLGLPGPA
ncbi:NUDIX hydrolase domain-like protein [Rhodotorula diobovata]|uniref:NUDIX hydrolase domain-like protein n=1 Tax=Rhodotorula diobovata TaxID=5288 RepID=A0A5C5G1L8_9BASI|nr:NUDIX hydrolase domain-like protein [Rhodotorula diobovata]